MKNSILVVLSLLVAAPVFAKLSGRESGGGTSKAAEFVFVGKAALDILVGENIVSREKALEVINATAVFDVPQLCRTDLTTGAALCLDAEYDSSNNRISFDSVKWTQKPCNEKFVLAAHEYLRAAGLEDSDYRYSNSFYSITSELRKNIVGNTCWAINTTPELFENNTPICTVDRVNNAGSIRWLLKIDGKLVKEFDGTEEGRNRALNNAKALAQANRCIFVD